MSSVVNALRSHHNGTSANNSDDAQSIRDKFLSGKNNTSARVLAICTPATFEPITCHSFNASATEVAVSRNSNDVEILQVPSSNHISLAGSQRNASSGTSGASAGSWPVISTLKAHDLRVTGIDWAPNSNRIVTCSADRNAYVWTPDVSANGGTNHAGGKPINGWKKTLVLLRTNRAATCVKWSPSENKFAVGCGSKLVSVCYFDEENDWWLSKHIKKPLKSTVTCVDWHSNDLYLAVGSSDFRARVYSAYVKEIDPRPDPKDSHNAFWGDNVQWGNVMAEYASSCWIHTIQFCRFTHGDRLLWIAHDCTLNIVDAAQSVQRIITCRTKYLPFYTAQWLSPSLIIAAGNDCAPHLYLYDGARTATNNQSGQRQDQAIVHLGTLDRSASLNDSYTNGGGENGDERTGVSALKKFRDLDLKASSDVDDTSLPSLHQNTITHLSVLTPATATGGNKQATSSITFATSGQDGMLIMWQMPLS